MNILDQEQRIHVQVHEMTLDKGFTSAYKNPFSLSHGETMILHDLNDYVTNGPLDLTSPRLALYVDQKFSPRKALYCAGLNFLVSLAAGVVSGILKRDWASGLGVGFGIFGFIAVVQVLVTWFILF